METMKFQIMSDLHLETHPSYEYDFIQTCPRLALLGDIGHVANDALFTFLERQLRRYKIVFYLLGNHEPYHLSMSFTKKRVRDFSSKMERLKDKVPSLGKFVYLDQTRYDLNEQITVLGCTLYSRILPEQATAVASRLVDFGDILDWDVGEHVDAHLSDLAWLNGQISEIAHTESNRKIIVFTHYCPCTDKRVNNPRYRPSEVSSGFTTNLEDEECWKNPIVSLWAFGHTHFNCDFQHETGKRVLANQKGYLMFPQDTFRPMRIFEVGDHAIEAANHFSQSQT